MALTFMASTFICMLASSMCPYFSGMTLEMVWNISVPSFGFINAEMRSFLTCIFSDALEIAVVKFFQINISFIYLLSSKGIATCFLGHPMLIGTIITFFSTLSSAVAVAEALIAAELDFFFNKSFRLLLGKQTLSDYCVTQGTGS